MLDWLFSERTLFNSKQDIRYRSANHTGIGTSIGESFSDKRAYVQKLA
jgi:hypothetical protein